MIMAANVNIIDEAYLQGYIEHIKKIPSLTEYSSLNTEAKTIIGAINETNSIIPNEWLVKHGNNTDSEVKEEGGTNSFGYIIGQNNTSCRSTKGGLIAGDANSNCSVTNGSIILGTGHKNLTLTDGCTVVGQNASTPSDGCVFAVGVGTSVGDAANGLEVNRDGSVVINGDLTFKYKGKTYTLGEIIDSMVTAEDYVATE